MKKQKLIEEIGLYLTEDTIADKSLNPIDLNVLAMLQYVANEKVPRYNKDGWFIIPLGKNDKIKAVSLEEHLEDFEVKVTYRTIQRSISKLSLLKYIKYKQGFWNIETKKGCLPEIKILKGTNPDFHELVEDTSIDSVSNSCDETTSNTKITDCDTDSYSDIVITTDTNTYTDTYSKTNSKIKLNKKENIKEKNNIYEYLSQRSLGGSFELFCQSNPSVGKLGIPMDELRAAYDEVKCYGF